MLNIRMIWASLAFLALIPLTSLTQGTPPPQVKVNKNLISLSSVDTDGRVTITGQTGAIQGSDIIKTYARHESTRQKVPFEADTNGAFTVVIEAQGGDKVRIYAQHLEGKQSYGTFTVPGEVSSPAAEPNAAPVLKTSLPPEAGDPMELLILENEKLRAENQLLKEQLNLVLLQVQDLEKLIQTLLKEMEGLPPAKPQP